MRVVVFFIADILMGVYKDDDAVIRAVLSDELDHRLTGLGRDQALDAAVSILHSEDSFMGEEVSGFDGSIRLEYCEVQG